MTTNAGFDARRESALGALREASRDKSPKGSLDVHVAGLCEIINGSARYFTTSSCSGRVAVMQDGWGICGEGRTRGHWHLVSHDPVSFEAVKQALDKARGDTNGGEKQREQAEEGEEGEEEAEQQQQGQRQGRAQEEADADADVSSGMTMLRMEPFILAVECLDVAAGSKLVGLAAGCGMRESGMQVTDKGRVMASLRSTGLRMEAPVVSGEGEMLGDERWLRALVEAANARLEENLRKVRRLETEVRRMIDDDDKVGSDTTARVMGDLKGLERVEAEMKDGSMQEVAALEVSSGIAQGVKQWMEATGRSLSERKVDKCAGNKRRLLLPLRLLSEDWTDLNQLEREAKAQGRALAPVKAKGPVDKEEDCVRVVRASLRLDMGKKKRLATDSNGASLSAKRAKKEAAKARYPESLVAALVEAFTNVGSAEHAYGGVQDPNSFATEYMGKWAGKNGGVKHERLGRDLVILPQGIFTEAYWPKDLSKVWAEVAKFLRASKLARQAEVDAGQLRQSRAKILWHDENAGASASGMVEHSENGVKYCFDVTKCMFASGNGTERGRMGSLDDVRGKTAVDLFAGIGYFTLPLLVRAGVEKVYACEMNPDSVAALRLGLERNGIDAKRCEIFLGDCRKANVPDGVADHVNLGLLPSAQHCLDKAVACLRDSGGRLCVHENVHEKDEERWASDLLKKVAELGMKRGKAFGARVRMVHVERVKSYAPRVWHLVADVICGDGIIQSSHSGDPEGLMDVDFAKVISRLVSPATGSHVTHRADASGLSWGELSHLMRHLSRNLREPCVVSGIDLGSEFSKWKDVTHLSQCADSSTIVGVHVCAPEHKGHLDFTTRNFEFHSMPLSQLYGRCADPQKYAPIIGRGESYYFRSLGARARKDPARVEDTFPAMAAAIPRELVRAVLPDGVSDYFSSILRVSGGQVHLWPHFDVMDNVLLQGCGEKRVVCFPPACDTDLHACAKSSSSPVLDMDNPDQTKWPRFKRAHALRREAALAPGDILFLPALWWHRVSSVQGPSVAVNIFWKHMPLECYDPHDLYGNREPMQVRDARKLAEALPPEERRFWFRRLARGDGDVE